MKKIFFFEIEPWEKDQLTRELGGLALVFFDDKLDHDRLPRRADADILSVSTSSTISKQALDHFPKLSFIATRSIAYDHIDLDACRERKIAVSNVPAYGSHSVAEYAFALILALSRNLYQAIDRMRETGSFSLDGLRGRELHGKTLGVIGTGRIGSQVIRAAKGFGMRVLAYDTRQNLQLAGELNFTYLPLEALLGASDVITVHVPYLAVTHHLLNRENLRKAKRGALLINTARGGVIETEGLVQALQAGILGGAALDVLEEEGVIKEERELILHSHPDERNLKSISQNHVLIGMPNVIVSPHNAFNTQEALEEILQVTAENIRAHLRRFPQNVVS